MDAIEGRLTNCGNLCAKVRPDRMMNIPKTLPTLPHEIHEWIEIQVWQEGGQKYWVSGSYSPGGERRHIYCDALISAYSTREEAIRIGMTIARQASAARLIAGVPFRCNFKDEP